MQTLSRTAALGLVLGGVMAAGVSVPAQRIAISQSSSISTMEMDSTTPMAHGNGIIVGRAVDAAGSRPVAGAVVTLTLPGSAPLRVMTDAQGQFAFRDLPAGRFTVTASRAGYVD